MTIDFFIPNTDNIQNIHINITLEDPSLKAPVTFTYNTFIKILPEEWDFEKQRPKNIYLKKNKKINSLLDEFRIRISQYIRDKKEKKKPVSQRSIGMEINKIRTEEQALYPELSLLHCIQMYIESKKEFISKSTRKRYHVFSQLIHRYEGARMERLYVNTLESSFINNFISFGKQELYSENTIYRTIHFVRTILNFAERKGLKTTVREWQIRRERQRRVLVTLSEEEILSIKNIQLPPELMPAKDWLIISCYTGQRISDFMDYTKEMIVNMDGISCIAFTQKKTKKNILLPLHPAVIDVLKRNGNNFPPKISKNLYNRHIKEIAMIAGITQPVKTRKREGHRVHSTTVEKWEAITSHIGRRSFATIFYGKIPTPLLMEATGHSTEQMFLNYINPVDKNRISSLNHYFNKIHNSHGKQPALS